MAELPVYPTDAAMCRLLAEGPLPTAAIADRLAIPERTVRHRLLRLRQAGTVVAGADGSHGLARAATAIAGTTAAPDRPPDDERPSGLGKPSGAVIVLAAAALGLAAGLGIRRMATPPPPTPATGFGNVGDPWGGVSW